jgi:uncharacterized membrane protein
VVRWLIGWLGTGLAFAAVDAVWLTQVGPRLYRPALDEVLAAQVAMVPAVAFYLIYTAAIVILAAAPAVRGEWWRAGLSGLVLGVAAYGAYDLTNAATLKVWSTAVTLADMAWGGFATALAAVAGRAALRWAERLG